MTDETSPKFGTTECLTAFGGFVAIGALLCVISLRPPATIQKPTITPIAVEWAPQPAPPVDRLEFDPSTEPAPAL